MKKGFYRAMIALLAVPMVGAALTGCDNGKDPGSHEEEQQTDFKSIEIVNKEALASGEWFAKGAISDLELKVTKKDGTVIEGVALDDLWADELLTLSSSDEAVISTGGGFLTIAGEGTATVTVTLDGVLTDQVTITVLAYDDPIKNKPEMVTTPVAGTAYKFGVEQYGLATPSMLYLKTTVLGSGSYYWATTDAFGEALDVVVEEAATPNGDYKWNLKTEEGGKVTYLGAAASADSKHVNDTNESTPTTLWKWDAEHKTFLANLEIPEVEGAKPSGDYYLGTSGTYNTLSLSHAETYINEENSWLGHLYVIPQVMDVTNKEITLLTQERTTDKINVVKPQGEVTFTVKSGDSATVDTEGNLTMVKEGVTVITVSDTKTEIDVTVTVRAPQKGEISTMPMTGAEAIAKASTLDSKTNEQTEEKYYIEDTIVDNPSTDYCNFNYSDGTNKIVVYGLWTSDGSQRYGTKRDNIQPEFVAGDKVKVHGNLQNYGGKLEVTNAWLKGFEHQEVTVGVEVEHATVAGLPASGKAMNCSTVTFTVTPETDYEVKTVSVYGQALTEKEGSYSFVVKGAAVINIVTRDTTSGGETELTLEKTDTVVFAASGDNVASVSHSADNKTNTWTKGNLTVTSIGSTAYDGNAQIRWYANGTLKIECPTGFAKLVIYSYDSKLYNGTSVSMSAVTPSSVLCSSVTKGTVDSYTTCEVTLSDNATSISLLTTSQIRVHQIDVYTLK